MRLNELKPAEGSTRNSKRLGRGQGSGRGKTCGKGHKGQKARSGARSPRGFEGGQMPLQRRVPKVGFTNIFKKKYAIVNLAGLSVFEKGAVIDTASLIEAGLVSKVFDGIKVLGNGEIASAVTLKVDSISKTARKKIEAAGGTVVEAAASTDAADAGEGKTGAE